MAKHFIPGKPLTASAINLIAFEVRDGIADPEDARALLALYCELRDSGTPIPDRLLEHLRESFTAVLAGKRVIGLDERTGNALEVKVATLDAAFGLKKRQHRPRAAMRPRDIDIAAEMLRHLISGTSYEVSRESVAEKMACGTTKVATAFRKHLTLASEKVRRDRPWTPEERTILTKIFDAQHRPRRASSTQPTAKAESEKRRSKGRP
jgi:hypothetical protein